MLVLVPYQFQHKTQLFSSVAVPRVAQRFVGTFETVDVECICKINICQKKVAQTAKGTTVYHDQKYLVHPRSSFVFKIKPLTLD